MPKPGRPKLPKNRARKVFSVRFSKEELDSMKRTAKRSGKKVREWARNCLLDSVHD
jgi:Mobilization protein NikA